MTTLDKLYRLDQLLARLNLPHNGPQRRLLQEAINDLKPRIGGETNPPETDD